MFAKPLLFALKGIPHAKYENSPNLVQILPQDHTHFNFGGFQWNILEHSINNTNKGATTKNFSHA